MSNQAASSAIDPQTATRLREEWEQVKAATQGSTATEISDPVGQDGQVTLKLSAFRATGAGEVVLLKGAPPADHRYTRFRAWGPNGSDFIEKSSYLVKENGHKEFHRRRLEPGDNVVTTHEPDGDDQSWISTL